jgi:hypothetical protein
MNSIKAFITVLTYYLLYFYLERFEMLSCTCSYDLRKDLLKTMILVFYVLIFGKLIFKTIPNSVLFFVLLYTILFDVLLFTYVRKMMTNKCVCQSRSQDIITNIIYYYYLILLLIVISSILLSIIFISFKRM